MGAELMIITQTLAAFFALQAFVNGPTGTHPSEQERAKSRAAFGASSEGILMRARPSLLRAELMLRQGKLTDAENACWQAYSILAIPMFQQIALDHLADVYLAEHKDQAALNIWVKYSKGAAPDFMRAPKYIMAYADMGRPRDALPYVQIWLKAEERNMEIFDADDLPIDQELTSNRMMATGLLLQGTDGPEYWEGGRRADLTLALKLDPNNGNINFQLARIDPDFEEALKCYRLAYLHGGTKVKAIAKRMLIQLNQPLPGG